MTTQGTAAQCRISTAERVPAACLLGLSGFRTQKVPKNEAEHGQDDHQHRPKYFLPGIRAALKDIDDRPDVGDQNYETEQALVLHFLSSLAAVQALNLHG